MCLSYNIQPYADFAYINEIEFCVSYLNACAIQYRQITARDTYHLNGIIRQQCEFIILNLIIKQDL
jgi:hypothetical protein